jgi:16S rRNA (guanine527-N7)-methyltransferase
MGPGGIHAGSEEWKSLLIREAGRAGVVMDAHQADQMAVHAAALLEWNRKMNLTAITDPEDVAVKHFLDAVLPLPHLPREPALLDIGTGAGFPGIPLKIMRPGQAMVLIDASRKKINFVKHVLRLLKLADISAYHERAEAMAEDPSHRRRYGAIVCRAFAGLDTIARLAAPLLTADGRVYVYQGPSGQEAPAPPAKPTAYRVTASHAYRLPSGDRRTLTVLIPTMEE